MDNCNPNKRSPCNCDPKVQAMRSEMKHLCYIVDNILARSDDIPIKDLNDILFFGRLFKIFLEIKHVNERKKQVLRGRREDLEPLTKPELFALCDSISKIISEMESFGTHGNGVFASIFRKAIKAVGFSTDNKDFSNFCEIHFLGLDFHVQNNILRPVEILEEKLLQHVSTLFFKTRDFELMTELMKVCPAFDIQLLTKENNQSVLHAATSERPDVSQAVALCLEGVPFEDLEEFVNLQRTDDGNTALHLASERGKTSIVKCLLEHRANTAVVNNLNKTALNLASNFNIMKLIKTAELFDAAIVNEKIFSRFYLKYFKQRSNMSALDDLFSAINTSDIHKMRDILKRDKHCVNDATQTGESPLKRAITFGEAKVVRVLLKNGADASARYGNMNALHWAVREGDIEIVDDIADYIDNVNVPALGTGNTALHMAAQSGDFPIVKCLLAHGANFQAQNNSHQTPKDVSSEQEIIDLLDAIADLHRVVRSLSVRNKSAVGRVFSKVKFSDDSDVFLKATNDDGKTAVKLMMESKGLAYLMYKKYFLSA